MNVPSMLLLSYVVKRQLSGKCSSTHSVFPMSTPRKEAFSEEAFQLRVSLRKLTCCVDIPKAYWSGLSSSMCSESPICSMNIPNRKESRGVIFREPSQ